jgi:hypothetical protein
MLIDSSPEIVQFAACREEHLIEMPFVAGLATATQLVRILLAKLPTPLTNSFIAQHDTSGGHELFHITVAEGETIVEPDRVRDDLGRKSIAPLGG